jgi:hypothetical protein
LWFYTSFRVIHVIDAVLMPPDESEEDMPSIDGPVEVSEDEAVEVSRASGGKKE